jgi:uncharacterized protein YvpB
MESKEFANVVLEVPCFSQRNNKIDPTQTCNTTAMAMVAAFHGIVGDNSYAQLEDQFSHYMAARGYNRYDMESMTKFLNQYYGDALNVVFSAHRSVDGISDLLRAGIPVIVSGKFTPSWHFIVIRGYTRKVMYIVNDPWGEYYRTGYDGSKGNGVELYSAQLINKLCNDDNSTQSIWSIAVDGDGSALWRQMYGSTGNSEEDVAKALKATVH